MKVIKAIRIFYIIYSFYTLFVMMVSNYQFTYAFIGLLFVWATFVAFKLGFISKSCGITNELTNNEEEKYSQYSFPLSKISYWPAWKYILAFIASWISAIQTAKFYTGRNFALVIQGLLGGNSAYNSYQSYFLHNNIASFSITKIPYILMLAFLTIITIWSFVGILLSNEKIGIWRILYIIGIASAYAYFGVARGTNFETYILFILLAYCLLQKIEHGLSIKNIKYFIFVFIAGIILIFVYRARIMDRGIEFENTICPEISFDSESFLAKQFPALVNIGLSLFGYLGYGIFCIGVTISDICFNSTSNIIGFFIPFGHRLFNDSTLSNSLAHTISMGAKWTPDFINFIDVTGIILYFIIIFFGGVFFRHSYKMKAPVLLRHIIGALLFVEMLSIPVGNFLVASTSNEIMLAFTIVWVFQCGHFRFTFGKSIKK